MCSSKILYNFKPVDLEFLFLEIPNILTYWKWKGIGFTHVDYFHSNTRARGYEGNARFYPHFFTGVLRGTPVRQVCVSWGLCRSSSRARSHSLSLSLWRDGDITFCYLKWAQREGLFLRKNYKISRLLFSSAAIPFISTGNWNRGRHLWDVINRNLGWGYIQIGFKSVESNCVIFETFLTGIVLATCPVWAIGSSHTDVQD